MNGMVRGYSLMWSVNGMVRGDHEFDFGPCMEWSVKKMKIQQIVIS